MPIVLSPATPNPTSPSTATSSDGHLIAYVDPTYGGVLLKADFSGLGTQPWKVRFLRGTDRVRSGDPAFAPGGVGFAYDHEAPLEAACSWTAVPIFTDGTEGTPSTAATVTTAGIPSGFDFWIKSTEDPGLSVAVSSRRPDPTSGRVGMLNLYDVQGSQFKAGGWQPRQFADEQFTFATATHAARKALDACLDSGVVFVQADPDYWIDDFYAIAGDSSHTAQLFQRDSRRLVTVNLTHQARPATTGSRPIIPGRSWGALADGFASWTAVKGAFATNEDLLRDDYPAPDGLLLESGGAGDEGSP